MIVIKCQQCKKEFQDYVSDHRKFCSRKCCANSRIGKKRLFFSNEWKENISKSKKGVKLSEEHKRNIGLSHKGKPRPWMIGKKHALGHIGWNKGGRMPQETRRKLHEAHKRRWDIIGRKKDTRPYYRLKDFKYKWWRERIYKYDDYTCWICENKGDKLNAHHLKDWIRYPKLRYKVSNGLSLCLECHKIYTEYGNNLKKEEKVNLS